MSAKHWLLLFFFKFNSEFQTLVCDATGPRNKSIATCTKLIIWYIQQHAIFATHRERQRARARESERDQEQQYSINICVPITQRSAQNTQTRHTHTHAHQRMQFTCKNVQRTRADTASIFQGHPANIHTTHAHTHEFERHTHKPLRLFCNADSDSALVAGRRVAQWGRVMLHYLDRCRR